MFTRVFTTKVYNGKLIAIVRFYKGSFKLVKPILPSLHYHNKDYNPVGFQGLVNSENVRRVPQPRCSWYSVQYDENRDLRPCAYDSCKLSKVELNYGVGEKEMPGRYSECMKVWHTYLGRREFDFEWWTDHSDLQILGL
jgi:hypothetical protein